jgi:predicted small lipoprotein YifL
MRRFGILAVSVALACSLAACGKKDSPKTPSDEAPARITTIGVNAYLWRAALDTIAFMPLAQVDSNGGIIITDWYSTPSAPNERVKVTVSILDTELRADAIKVSANRQTIAGSGWVDAPVRPGTVQKLEETILSKARDLRRAQFNG